LETGIKIFILACYGEGEPTDNAKDFFKWLMSEESKSQIDFKKVKYTIFGLGNKSCFPERYQLVSINVDKRLQELGAKRVYEFGQGDSPTLDDDFMKWKQNFLEQMSTENKKESETQAIKSNFNVNIVNSKNERKTVFTDHDPSKATNQFNPNVLNVLMEEELIPKSVRSCKHIEFDIRDKPDLKYETGDHLGVFPNIRKELVDRMLERLSLNGKDKFTIESNDSSEFSFF
jgi:NADPH-ferrihemoprotein reductase